MTTSTYYNEYKNPYTTGNSPSTLEVRTLKESWSFPYAHFLYDQFKPSGDLVIFFATHQVIVAGTNLKKLHAALTYLGLTMIELTDKSGTSPKEDSVVIDSIKIISNQNNE